MPSAVPILALALAGAGTAGNLIQGAEQGGQAKTLEGAQTGEINWLQNYQKYLQSLTPADISKMISEATQPLQSNLVQSVTTPIEATLAEKGLGQAPGILAQEEGTALAPFQQNSQNMALQAVMQLLGLPLQAGNSILSGTSNAPSFIPPPSNTGGAWQLALQSLQNRNKTGGTPSPTPTGPSFPFDIPATGSGGGGLSADTFNSYVGLAA